MIHLLLQRLVHADTRFPVREDLLATVFAPKLEELELLQTWNEELVTPLVDDGADLGSELGHAAQAFEDTLNATETPEGLSLRALLESTTDAGQARRLLAAEIKRRRSKL